MRRQNHWGQLCSAVTNISYRWSLYAGLLPESVHMPILKWSHTNSICKIIPNCHNRLFRNKTGFKRIVFSALPFSILYYSSPLSNLSKYSILFFILFYLLFFHQLFKFLFPIVNTFFKPVQFVFRFL